MYIGLLMAGATPCVVGQTPSATTRPFSVKDELERKENLDKKPDDEILNFSSAIKEYFDDFEELVESLQKYNWKEGFDRESDRFEFERLSSLSCKDGYDPVVSGGFLRKLAHPGIEKAIHSAFYDFYDWETFSDCLEVKSSINHRIHRFHLGISYDSSELELKISVPKKNARQAELLAERFNHALSIFEVGENDDVIRTIRQYTRIVSNNDQVLVITRLPRAGLDALLSSDAK